MILAPAPTACPKVSSRHLSKRTSFLSITRADIAVTVPSTAVRTAGRRRRGSGGPRAENFLELNLFILAKTAHNNLPSSIQWNVTSSAVHL